MVDFTNGSRPRSKPAPKLVSPIHKVINHSILLSEVAVISTDYILDLHSIVVTLKSGSSISVEFREVKTMQRYHEELLEAWERYCTTSLQLIPTKG